MDIDEQYMRRALALAGRGLGLVNPNPLVGALIVKNGNILAEGWHRRFGELHAEREALAACSPGQAKGAHMYVTLEPCCHYGKTPPCIDAILKAGISCVVVGCQDPNPAVSGRGIARLRSAGVEVLVGVLEDECRELNRPFFHYISTGLPYFVMKYAMTLDGRIATAAGSSRWITGEAARLRTHRDRWRYAAIMVGVGTAIADDPMLTCRIPGGRNPIRIVCDTWLRLPMASHLVQSARDVPLIIATASEDNDLIKRYESLGCEFYKIQQQVQGGGIDLRALVERLGARGIDSVLLEGGAVLNWAALKAGIVSRVQAYVAPKFFGGAGAFPPILGEGILNVEDAFRLENMQVSGVGEDILIEADLIKPDLIKQ